MMNLKSHKFFKNFLNKKSGFMLSEVMIALVISSLVIMPILEFVSNYIKRSAQYRDMSSRILAMRNVITEETFYAVTDKKRRTANKEVKIKDLNATVRYTRKQMQKVAPFVKFGDDNLKNLVIQQVEFIAPGVKKDTAVSFLYLPNIEKKN